MRTLLICHEAAALDREGLARWLGSFSTFAGTVVIREPRGRLQQRIKREVARVGPLRFLDVVAFHVYYALVHLRLDRLWEQRELARLRHSYPEPPDAREVVVSSPNSADAEHFIRESRPDVVLARCKTLLRDGIFTIPRLGTYVLHPGICPEYRNAHGCFWARARGDERNVGATLLRVDRGVDTGPVYGYYHVDAAPGESHLVTGHRVVLEHLDAIRDRLLEIAAGTAKPFDTSGRPSATWGQPWLTAYLKMRARGSRRSAIDVGPPVSGVVRTSGSARGGRPESLRYGREG
jgi:Formyl transferase